MKEMVLSILFVLTAMKSLSLVKKEKDVGICFEQEQGCILGALMKTILPQILLRWSSDPNLIVISARIDLILCLKNTGNSEIVSGRYSHVCNVICGLLCEPLKTQPIAISHSLFCEQDYCVI